MANADLPAGALQKPQPRALTKGRKRAQEAVWRRLVAWRQERFETKLGGTLLRDLRRVWQSNVVRNTRPAAPCGSRTLRIVSKRAA